MTRLHVSARFAPYSATPELAVRHAADVAHTDGMYRESFGPDAWLARGQNATVQYDHDTEDIGQVIVVSGCGDGWYHADMQIESDDPAVLERIRVGAPVSVGARVLTRSTVTHTDTRVCRHGLAQLEHIAILPVGSLPGYRGAKITSVSEAKTSARTATTSGVDWRSVLPREWAEGIDVANLPADAPVSISDSRRGLEWRWTGTTFVASGRIPIAA